MVILVKDWGIEYTSSNIPNRDTSLTDKSMETVVFTMWRQFAYSFTGQEQTAVAIQKAYVGEFGNRKSIYTKCDTLIWVNYVTYKIYKNNF